MTGPTGPTGPTGTAGATGATGATTVSDYLSAYSTPTAPVTSGNALEFDKNATLTGTALSHTEGASTVTINTQGTYYVAYSGTVSPKSGTSSFPVNNLLTFRLNGTNIPGAASQHVFSAANQTESQSFSAVFAVTSVPASFVVYSAGGNFNYSNTSLNVVKLG